MHRDTSLREVTFPALVVLTVLFLQACTSSGAPSVDRSVAPTTSPASQGRVFIRTCESSVYGRLGHGWGAGEVTLGPVTFVGLHSLASVPPSRLMPTDGRDPRLKVIAVVRSGPPVTVRVSLAQHAALVYDPRMFNARRVSAGDSAVAFEPCMPGQSPFGGKAGDRPTQFNGAFIVDGPGCVLVQVTVAGGESAQRSVPFGSDQVCP
jgi:hypothetical protein